MNAIQESDAEATGFEDFAAHGINDGPVVGRAEHGRTSHEGVRTGRMDDTDVVDFHAAVDFQTDGLAAGLDPGVDATAGFPQFLQRRDRKSTRLNSSHVKISYAVF